MNSGVYLLVIKCKSQFKTGIKKFQNVTLPAGFYYYSGSAQKNLSQRIERHLLREKKIHWHIDHITTNAACCIQKILVFQSKPKSFECNIVAEILKEENTKIILAGFGNSDCNRCESHLLFSGKEIDYSHFISRYHAIDFAIPFSNSTV